MMCSRWLAAALLWAPLISAVQAAGPQFDGAGLNKIPGRMQELIDRQQISGAVLLIGTKDGGFQHLDAYGQADIAAGRPMQKDAIFRIASMTKPITATTLMQLVAEGKVNVDDPVAKYIPSFAKQSVKEGDQIRPLGKPITIRHLLTHTSGIGYGVIDGDARFKKIYAKAGVTDLFTTDRVTIAESVKKLAKLPLHHHPGEKFKLGINQNGAGGQRRQCGHACRRRQ